MSEILKAVAIFSKELAIRNVNRWSTKMKKLDKVVRNINWQQFNQLVDTLSLHNKSNL